MNVIWKYPCPLPGESAVIKMPNGAWIIRVEDGCFWAVVNPEAEMEPRKFRTIATGEEFDGCGVVGSWRAMGIFVWHLISEKTFTIESTP